MEKTLFAVMILAVAFLTSLLFNTILFRGREILRWLHYRFNKRAEPALPQFLPILEELSQEWGRLTDEDIERSHRNLGKAVDGEKPLGQVHSAAARRTWALSQIMGVKREEARLHALGRSSSEEEAAFYKEIAARCDSMQDVLLQAFWCQAKDDTGKEAWEAPLVGLRSGWMLVSPRRPSMPNFAELLGGRQT